MLSDAVAGDGQTDRLKKIKTRINRNMFFFIVLFLTVFVSDFSVSRYSTPTIKLIEAKIKEKKLSKFKKYRYALISE